MKFGIHLSTYTKTWSEDISEFIKLSKELGYDGVEFPLGDPDNFMSEKLKPILKDNQLMCTCGTGLNLNRDISSLDKNIVKNGMEHLKKCINICNEMESDCLGGVLYAPWGQCMTREDGKKNIYTSLENLKLLGDYAKDKGVVLALEMLNRYETYFLNNVNEGKEYLSQINHSNIKLHFDTFHANIEEKSLKEAIIEGGSDIYHIHFCENNRGIPGTGHINWIEIREALKYINYDRWITIENFVMPDCEVGKDVFIWRLINESGTCAAKEGIKFMKKLFKE